MVRFILTHYQTICEIVGTVVAVVSLFISVYSAFYKDSGKAGPTSENPNLYKTGEHNHYEHNHYYFVNNYFSSSTAYKETDKRGLIGPVASVALIVFSIILSYFIQALPALILINVIFLIGIYPRLKYFNIPFLRFRSITCSRFYIASHFIAATCLVIMMQFKSIQNFYTAFYQMPNTDMSSYFNYVVKGLFNGVWFEWFSVTLWILTWLFYLLITLSLIFLTSSVNKEKWSFATRLTTILSRAWFFPMFMLMILGCITFLHATIN